MNLTIIGDVHGKVDQYKQITDNCEFSICVGDFGFQRQWDWYHQNIKSPNHWINMGNHDYLPYVNLYPSTGNYKFFPNFDLFTVRCADSIDVYHRTVGLDWFRNEQLAYVEGLLCFDEYNVLKPKIIVSHDCPQLIMEQLFGYTEKTNTRQLLQAMVDVHQPDIVIFGHHHKSCDIFINNTRYICLAELETLTLNF